MSPKKSKKAKTKKSGKAGKAGKTSGRKPPKRWATGGKKKGRVLSDEESRAIDDAQPKQGDGAGSFKFPAGAEKAARPRDPRLPAAGETILRTYKGEELSVDVLERGFRWKGDEYRSLSKLAAVVTGQKAINGFAFFKLTTPKGKAL